ncbi:Protein of unknown function [Gryllus bimaculatus]|nr:Protein of unknown function [Gryllus bimaculatus]
MRAQDISGGGETKWLEPVFVLGTPLMVYHLLRGYKAATVILVSHAADSRCPSIYEMSKDDCEGYSDYPITCEDDSDCMEVSHAADSRCPSTSGMSKDDCEGFSDYPIICEDDSDCMEGRLYTETSRHMKPQHKFPCANSGSDKT